MIFDLSFSGDPLAVSDAAGGHSEIIVDAAPTQSRRLLKPRPSAFHEEPVLYLDGWTTRVEWHGARQEHAGVRLAAAFAPRAFSRGDDRGFTALIDATHNGLGVALGHLRTGHAAALVDGILIAGQLRLARDQWHRLVLEVTGGRARLLVDGAPTAEIPHLAAIAIPSTVFVGGTARAVRHEDLFNRGLANGLLARASATAITQGSVPDALTDASGAGAGRQADTHPDRARYETDPHRPIAHLSAPQGWMNEPHAPIEIDGQHHLFFQHNPVGPYWDGIAWAHAVSDDLVHWRDAPLALTPADTTVAPDGIWSGASVQSPTGEHLLYFTAGDMSLSPDQAVAVARPCGQIWQSNSEPVLRMPSTVPGRREALVPGQFRDPFVWREGRDWFMLVGAGLEGAGGAALLFRSEDGLKWRHQEPLMVGDVGRFPATGVMWELPVLLPVGSGADGLPRHVLLVAPWWSGPSEHHLQHVWHWVGRWDAAIGRFLPDHAEPREFDGGGHLTGPSGTVLADGRSILWTIAQDKRGLQELADSGWAHNAGLPLELGLHEDGRLSVRPVAELTRLRAPKLELGRGDILARGRHLDIEIEITGAGFELDVLRTDDESEVTVLGVTGPEVWIDRSRSSRNPEHTEGRRSITRPGAATVCARVIIDGSMIEVYVDDRVSLTSRAYTQSSAATGVRLRLADRSRLDRLAVFPLRTAYSTGSAAPTQDRSTTLQEHV